jgi:hypothetical protein
MPPRPRTWYYNQGLDPLDTTIFPARTRLHDLTEVLDAGCAKMGPDTRFKPVRAPFKGEMAKAFRISPKQPSSTSSRWTVDNKIFRVNYYDADNMATEGSRPRRPSQVESERMLGFPTGPFRVAHRAPKPEDADHAWQDVGYAPCVYDACVHFKTVLDSPTPRAAITQAWRAEDRLGRSRDAAQKRRQQALARRNVALAEEKEEDPQPKARKPPPAPAVPDAPPRPRYTAASL